MIGALFVILATAILPPNIPWNGASRSLVVAANDPWITPAEKTGFRTTPSYDETTAYLRRLVAASPNVLRMSSIGKSPDGRDIWMVVASTGGKNKARVFAQGGIHSGEIDGKDAGLMLLRDMTVRGTKRELLQGADFLFVPIFNVDGHERASAYSRINQRGPENGGWRTNTKNYNLNRDYMKADTAEMRAMIGALKAADPDLYLDLHVTDGADYQYDVTFGANGTSGWSPSINGWLATKYREDVTRALEAAGHIPGDLVFGVDDNDLSKGLQRGGNADPRLSTGYGDARHTPTVLLENHSLKPYDQRVLGTYVFLEASLRTAAANVDAIRRAKAEDRARRGTVPFDWKAPAVAPPPVEFKGIAWRSTLSPVSGSVRVEYTGKPVTLRLPIVSQNEVSVSAERPAAYWVPAAWREVIEKLDLHGIQYDRIAAPREVEVDMYRFDVPKYEAKQFEGHVRVTAPAGIERRRERFPAGSVRVPTDQPLGALAVLLLEPASPDSLFQWGFLNSILSPTEYVEPYVMEPMAEKMLAENPALAAEFGAALAADATLRGDSQARLQWFYRRTPFYDERARLYPIAREP